MNNNELAAERYSINGFKYFSELAKEYFPDLANASSCLLYTSPSPRD